MKRSCYDTGEVDSVPADHPAGFCREVDPEVVRDVARYMTDDERTVSAMLADGRGPSSVAAILGLESKQAAAKVIGRTVKALGVLCGHAASLDAVARVGPRGKAIVLWPEWEAFKEVMLHRTPLEEIAKSIGCDVNTVAAFLNRVRRRLVDSGEIAMAEALSDMRVLSYLTNRYRGRSGIMQEWREKFRNMAMDMTRKGVAYVWGGQNPFGRIAKAIGGKETNFEVEGRADCSGLVIEMLKELGRIPRTFPDQSASGLARSFMEPTGDPRPGDLVFYGRSFETASHVMFYFGKLTMPKMDRSEVAWSDAVVGMSGGRRNMSLEYALLTGARMKFYSSPRYRKDFLGFKKVN